METLNLDSYVMAALSFHAIFMATYLFSAQNDRTDYLKLLGCTFIMLVAWYSSSFLEAVGAFNQYPQLISWPTLFIPLLAPSLYFYVQAISSPNKWDYRAQHKIHYYFAALIILIELPFTLAPGHIKVLQLYHMTVEPEGPAKILVTMAWISTALLLLQFACYIILAIRRLVNHATRIRHLFSNLENRTLIWLRNYLLLLCLLWGLGFSDFLDLPNQYGWLAHVIWVTTFSLLSLRQKPVFDAVEKTSLLTELAATDTAGKQGKTSLPIDRRSRIAEKLRRAMTADHLYRDADLTLRKLSDAVVFLHTIFLKHSVMKLAKTSMIM